jgi:hypothetical protein
MAAGSGRQTAQHHMTTSPTSPFSVRTIALRTAGSGRKTAVNITWQPAIRHRSLETASLTMLTTYHQSPHSYIYYCLACPHHLFLKIWYNSGGMVVLFSIYLVSNRIWQWGSAYLCLWMSVPPIFPVLFGPCCSYSAVTLHSYARSLLFRHIVWQSFLGCCFGGCCMRKSFGFLLRWICSSILQIAVLPLMLARRGWLCWSQKHRKSCFV